MLLCHRWKLRKSSIDYPNRFLASTPAKLDLCVCHSLLRKCMLGCLSSLSGCKLQQHHHKTRLQ